MSLINIAKNPKAFSSWIHDEGTCTEPACNWQPSDYILSVTSLNICEIEAKKAWACHGEI